MAFAPHNPPDMSGTVLKILSGTIIVVVAALSFVQSTNAYRSMGESFEKLMHDRPNAEARKMVAEIEDGKARGNVRVELIGKYTGIAIRKSD